MQDDTLSVSKCGFKTTKINNLINSRTNIMGLQFGKEKCVKMHIGKTQNIDICTDCEVDSWKENVTKDLNGKDALEDVYIGKETMRNIHEKKYLGDIISHNMNNYSNIKEKTNRAVGIVNKILTSLLERPYGRFTFRAAKIMRESMLVGSLLNNSESWINLNKTDIKKP
jgi:hypothetical protein